MALPGPASGDLDGGASMPASLAVGKLAAAELHHERAAGEVVVLPARCRAVQPLPPATLGREPCDPRITLLHPGGAVARQEHPTPRLVVPDGHVRLDAVREAPHRTALRLREGVRTRVVATGRRTASLPSIGKVAVQVDAVGVPPRGGRDAIGVDRLDNPQFDPPSVAIAVPQDASDLVTLGLVT